MASYIIPGTALAASPFRPSSRERPVELVHPFFKQPVVLGPDAQHIDFVVGTSAPPDHMVATGATWRYVDDGSDQGTAWQGTSFG